MYLPPRLHLQHIAKNFQIPLFNPVCLPQLQTYCFRFISASYKHFKLIIFQTEVVMLFPPSLGPQIRLVFIPLVSTKYLLLNCQNYSWVSLHIWAHIPSIHHIQIHHHYCFPVDFTLGQVHSPLRCFFHSSLHLPAWSLQLSHNSTT